MSSTIHYFHRDHIIRELEYLRNQREKCGICDEKFCPFCEAVKELENEMWKKAFFGVQLHVTEGRVTYYGPGKRLNMKPIL